MATAASSLQKAGAAVILLPTPQAPAQLNDDNGNACHPVATSAAAGAPAKRDRLAPSARRGNGSTREFVAAAGGGDIAEGNTYRRDQGGGGGGERERCERHAQQGDQRGVFLTAPAVLHPGPMSCYPQPVSGCVYAHGRGEQGGRAHCEGGQNTISRVTKRVDSLWCLKGCLCIHHIDWISTSLSIAKIELRVHPTPSGNGDLSYQQPKTTLRSPIYLFAYKPTSKYIFFVPCQSWKSIVDLKKFSLRHLVRRYFTRLRYESKKVANTFSGGTVGPLL